MWETESGRVGKRVGELEISTGVGEKGVKEKEWGGGRKERLRSTIIFECELQGSRII